MKYIKNTICYYNGCKFDSALELKFALLIEDEYAYLVHPKKIYDAYYHNEGKYVEILEKTAGYTPDFLIRSYEKNVAYLIEIKHEEFTDQEQMGKRNRIAGRYLRGGWSDIEFRWVFGFKLCEEKTEKFHHLMKHQKQEKKFYELVRSFYRRSGKVPFIFPREMSEAEYVDFVKNGNNPESTDYLQSVLTTPLETSFR